MSEMKASFLGISRHRLGIDGKGVVTLCAFMGCPLKCRYCINDECHDASQARFELTPQELLDKVRIDNIYFLATDGGITFGGGEPLLYSEFIEEFARLCDPHWAITLETSLNVPLESLQRVFPYVRQYYIDIKDMDQSIYEDYTQLSQKRMLTNLEWLMSNRDIVDKVVVRLPHIPEYNTQADVDRSRERLEAMGVKHFDEFNYRVRD